MLKFLATLFFCIGLFAVVTPAVNVAYAVADNIGVSQSKRINAVSSQSTIFDKVKNTISSVMGNVQKIALKLFYAVACLGIFLTGMRMIFSDQNIQAFFSEMFKFILTCGILVTAIQHSSDIANYIESFSTAAMHLGGTGQIIAGDSKNFQTMLFMHVLNVIDLISQKYDSVEANSWAEKIVICFMGGFIILLIMVILINYLITLFKMYLTVNLGVLALATAGCSLTNKNATNYLRECISYAAQLFVLISISSMAANLINELFIAPVNGQSALSCLTDYFLAMVVFLMFAVLSYSAPGAIGALFDAQNHAGNISPMAAGAAATGSVGGAVVNTTKGGAKATSWLAQKAHLIKQQPTQGQQLENINKNLEKINNKLTKPSNNDVSTGAAEDSGSKSDSVDTSNKNDTPSSESLFGR